MDKSSLPSTSTSESLTLTERLRKGLDDSNANRVSERPEFKTHTTPDGFHLNLNAIADEIRSVIVDRNGFLEPTPDMERVEISEVEVTLAMIFVNVLVPIGRAMEAVRKNKPDEAGTHLSETAFTLRRIGERLKELDDLVSHKHVHAARVLIQSKLALITTETTCEIHDNDYNYKDLTDAIIRILCFSSSMKVDTDANMAAEMAHNATREYRHGKHA